VVGERVCGGRGFKVYVGRGHGEGLTARPVTNKKTKKTIKQKKLKYYFQCPFTRHPFFHPSSSLFCTSLSSRFIHSFLYSFPLALLCFFSPILFSASLAHVQLEENRSIFSFSNNYCLLISQRSL
jgi:hypothetical protein